VVLTPEFVAEYSVVCAIAVQAMRCNGMRGPAPIAELASTRLNGSPRVNDKGGANTVDSSLLYKHATGDTGEIRVTIPKAESLVPIPDDLQVMLICEESMGGNGQRFKRTIRIAGGSESEITTLVDGTIDSSRGNGDTVCDGDLV
jgi:hypothetical protein